MQVYTAKLENLADEMKIDNTTAEAESCSLEVEPRPKLLNIISINAKPNLVYIGIRQGYTFVVRNLLWKIEM